MSMPLGPDQPPPRPKQDQKNEVVRLQSEIANEVSRDAPEIAQGIFGDNARHPDMATVSNQQLDQVYRQKYETQDRAWLQAEAKRDPEQFLTVAKRIGVQLPQPGEPTATVPPQAPPLAPPSAPVVPPPVPAVVPPVAVPPLPPPQAPLQAGPGAPVPMPGAPAPVILGPNGQPLPPSGVG